MNSCTGNSWNASPLNVLTCALWSEPSVWCKEWAFPLNEWACAFWEYKPLGRNIRSVCNYKAECIRLDLVDFCHLECFYDLCIQRVLKTPVNRYNWKEQSDFGQGHFMKWHATMMTMMMMMMMMMTGIFTYGRNTYRYSFRRYTVRTPNKHTSIFLTWWKALLLCNIDSIVCIQFIHWKFPTYISFVKHTYS